MTTHTPLRCANSFMVQRGSSEVVLMDAGAYPGVSNFLNETWKFDGTDWTNTSSTLVDANGPLPGRVNMAMAYDGYNVMMFGGQGGSAVTGALADTWTWGGASWTKKSPAALPSGRYFAKACRSTTTSTNVVLFGGSQANGQLLNDTWVWDGYASNWSQKLPASSPSARVGHVMDSSSAVTLLFGGQDSSGTCLNDTWTWNGTTWAKLGPAASPSARTGAMIAFDRTRSQWVLFGGMNEYYRLPETWTFNGTTWTQQSPTHSPAGRTWGQMCWDSQSGTVLLFGGVSAADNYASNHTWSWNGTDWTQL